MSPWSVLCGNSSDSRSFAVPLRKALSPCNSRFMSQGLVLKKCVAVDFGPTEFYFILVEFYFTYLEDCSAENVTKRNNKASLTAVCHEVT